ncbi:hypothetical protein PF005_g12889 [Phytophthora fragariae]|uniref:Reverse transcriptase domain-containing protein n=1 Tax=Phytophthora fragariae TaxID=53985 RepID=A0A6A3XQT4_9STRA|nr:hypothetical protein PF003_g13452 [Phytophthora fragariae]KAE8935976.1 hypothetical protein PF009_g14086 [Phytophthora fragariae]KAE9006184.1 hypothetical protein PF011_g11696 [Phytophthora fragariae]KAE9107438.1 hypothetical protein PF007_g13044 [Phytophthora fragariae]KAE9107498.1 hypothetical protein PF010_g12241 [Phytophthora fragariae]
MGVATAPDEFQAVMNRCLGDLDFCWVYLDDIMILSSSFEEHLRIVLQRMHDNRLTIHLIKSKIGATAVEYLGYVISCNGISPMHSKVDAIQRIAPPRIRRELRRFVGMVNYYRDVWPRRANLPAPLTALT